MVLDALNRAKPAAERALQRQCGYAVAVINVGESTLPLVGAVALPTVLAASGVAADGVATGAATHHVRSDRFADLQQSLRTALPYAQATGVKRLPIRYTLK